MTIQTLDFQGLSQTLGVASQKGLFAYDYEQFPKGVYNNSILPAYTERSELGKMIQPIFKGSCEGRIFNNEVATSFGANFDIPALSQLSPDYIKQKFYFVESLEALCPIETGIAPFAPSRVTIKTFAGIQNPESGLISTVNKGQYDEVETAIDNVTIEREFWAKQISYNFLQQAQMGFLGASGFDYVSSKLDALSTDYQLFVEKIFHYGFSKRDNTGLLTSSEVTVNTSLITKKLSAMTSAEFNAFIANVISVYQANQKIGEYPDTFYIPQSDYVGLVQQMSEDFPIKTKLQVLLEAMKAVTKNNYFKIERSFYNQKSFAAEARFKKANGDAPLSYDRYMLYKSQRDRVSFDMPIAFTLLGTGTMNQFDFVQLGYAQVGKVFFKRPADAIYFDNTNS